MPNLKRPAAGHFEAEPHIPRTLVERAYLGLRHDVISGKLAPGERLRVEHLKDQYEVGAGTLREALSLLVSDALVSSEGQRGFRVAPISLADLEDLTNTRVMLETEALRQSIRRGDAQWEAALVQSYERLSQTEMDLAESGSDLWERRNKAFHEALIAGFGSAWSKYLLSILYRHAERYRNIAWHLTAAHSSGRDVHREHEDIFHAAIARQDARAALALEAHIRLTHDVVKRQEKLV
jgi:DNA-binding GntR family transcriptional regulator